ncbi:BnaA08g00280D [Brassica napus]|uniref:BnaA08g00280D protein n=1 Tax=Brassica napus TaxID=3708 RepID=A0A078HXB4_BRANA|nr:BnaA08g00280D [Brassica napus]
MATIRELSRLIRDHGDEQVWITHYSSKHQILLVGEGDFSFSCSLATRFRSASNICASSLDSYADEVVRKYKKARSNLETLKRLGASLLHGVDATKLQLHPHLNCRRFDRIIFNFPHAGFHGKETDSSLIKKHRELVFGFLHSASHMVRADGECVAFEKSDYPGYENKRGDGSRCDMPFLLGECSTFKFRVSRVAKEIYAEKLKGREMKERESKWQRPALTFGLSYHQDHNLRQVHDPLVQSRQRTSPLFPYQEHRCSQFEDAITSVPHLYTGESPERRRQEPFFQRSNRLNGVSHEIYNGERGRSIRQCNLNI